MARHSHIVCGPAPYWASCRNCLTAANPLELKSATDWIPLNRLIEFLQTFERQHRDCPLQPDPEADD